ncbi:MAG: PP2C family protein-serine/threonine phosphatase [Pyrinomonadaceae bacterium]|nr:PP2C family protein-serine/threonine phosphatase [Pyrinomonadaceae bacterium]
MSENSLESQAFYRATLNSEWYRIAGLLAVLGVMLAYTLVRALAFGEFRLLLAQTLVLAIAIAHEAIMLRAIRRALKHDRDIPPVAWMLNVLVETQLPTVALFLLLASQWLTPAQVLVAPAVMVYFLFIILSTLRLSPSLTVLTGLLSALGYLMVVFYAAAKFDSSVERLAAFPRAVYFVYAAAILAGGILAAVVSGQVRGHVTVALREAELQNELERVNHDLGIARSIQQGLLPAKSPGMDQFDVAGWNQPADQTGGDYFDWQALPDGRFAISLADATGHGIGPALVSTSCRAYARASFLANGDQNGLLDRLNRLLAEDLSANRFVTFAVVFVDPSSSNVKVLSAGHGPILWYSYATEKIVNLEAHGIPLGMIAGVKYSHGTDVSLAPGDMLVLVTDGFYEWENPEGEQFGMSRLESVIRESRDSPSEEVIQRLRSDVMSFSRGTSQQDDLTAVIIRRKAHHV